jgi:hypothetical protein
VFVKQWVKLVDNLLACWATGAAANISSIYYPWGLALDASSTKLYISEGISAQTSQMSVVDLNSGIISKVVGNIGAVANLGDGGPATSASLNVPRQPTVDKQGRLYISDQVGTNQAVHGHTCTVTVT